jgi:hypothetical protein
MSLVGRTSPFSWECLIVVRRPGKSLLTWLLAAMIGGLSFLGEGLHDLLGLHQGPVVSDSHLLGFSARFYSGHENTCIAAANHRENCHDSATCPICQYLAQGRVVSQQVVVVSAAVGVPNRSPALPLFLPGPNLQPFQARAPPAA